MKQKTKKLAIVAALAATLAGGVLAGCGSNSQSSGSTGISASSENSGEEITLTVWSWDVALKQLEDCAAKYQETHPNVKFEFVEM